MIPRAVLSALAGLVLALAGTGAFAQSPPAPTLHVVALATVPSVSQRPATELPQALRGNPLYWRVLRSANAVSYQLCLGFFQTRDEAETVRRQLAASFPEARVIQVNAQERDNLQKATRAPAAAPAAAVAALPPAATTPPALVALPAPAAVAAQPLAHASPPPAVSTAPAPAGSAEALMAEGRGAIVREDYAGAIRAFTQLLALPQSSLTRDAQEFLALSYERRGDTARARTEYENYLKRYPDSEDSVRVRQRLVNLSGVPQMEALRAPSEPQQGWRSFTSGSLSQFYYRGNSKIDSQPLGPNALDRTTLSVVDQSALITSVNLNARFLDDTHENRVVFRDNNTRNFISGQDSVNRLDSAYYEYKYKPANASARLGRQPGNSAGLPGRFDGALLGYGLTSSTRLNLAAGEPVVPGFSIDSVQRFYGLSAELGPFNQRWTGNVYVFRQTVDGIADRDAIGMEARYFVPQGYFSSMVDYDTLFRHLNMATAQGNWIAPWKTAFNVLLDYRMTPSLQTTNAIIGEPTTSISQLLKIYSEDELRQRARAVTAESALAYAGLTHPVTSVWQLGANLSVSRISHTEGTNSYPATPGSGYIYTFTAQAIGTGLYATRDVTVISASRVSADTYRGLAGQFTSRFPLGPNWTLDGAVFWYGQDNQDGSTLQRISPVGRASYRWRSSVTLEFEAGIEDTKAQNATLQEDTRRYFFSAGYRWDF
ncbi:MAG TPA: tetratricopeptide repeat protein [Burkholderiales bacterium]